MTHAAPPKTRRTPSRPAVDPRFDWRRIAYNVLVSRALDDLEEATNRNRTSVPREHLILYQFSSRGHDLGQSILGTLLDRKHDAAGAYYRCRPLL
ncbi:MAG TPA: pyruvate dehydrogenase, partial [Gemmatimonadaceae bacterium]|nr:pyruvate dehydrogenase [Gemmatimonadaceae bacterium]